jgi:Right handed beta helix region
VPAAGDPTQSGAQGAGAPTSVPKAPVRVCGSSVLRGPSTPPPDAVVVRPPQNLDTVTQTHREGTTFWLAPGVHRLGSGEYDQVEPKTGNRYVGAPGAVLDGRRVNRYAFTGKASNVRLEYFTVQNFGARGDNPGEGVVNHDSGTGWVVAHMTIQRNAGAGVFLGDGNVVRSNCLRDNGEYGFSAVAVDGVRNIVLDGNEISGNNTDDWERRQPGCGCTGGGKFWDTRGGTVTGNYVHHNHGVGLWADTNNAGFRFRSNYIADNDAEGLVYEISYNAAIVGNTFVRNGLESWRTNPGFPTGAVYLSEAGSDRRVPTAYRTTLEVSHNVFVDNWGGVIAWENADRFAGSPNNTSTDFGTLVNPAVTAADCGRAALVRTMPYFSDCRWKTQNVKVHENHFSLDPGRVGEECTTDNLCGYSGVFANSGSSPDWSPYQGDVVQRHITFAQNNTWSDNTYVGPWRFMVLEQGNTVSWDTWRGGPYRQDAGSTLR